MAERTTNPNKKPRYGLRRAVAATVGVAALAGGAYIAKDGAERITAGVDKDELTDTYKVKPNDTAWDIADQRLPKEVDRRPLVDEIMRQANEDGNYGLQMNEEIQVPPTTEPEE